MPTLQLALAVSAALVAVLAIRAHYLDESRRWQVYAFKPLATLLILALALAFTPVRADYQWAIAAGLLFSTAGDIFLMLPRDRFVAGLASFLVAHLCYVGAFSIGVPFGAAPLLWLPFFAAGGLVLALVWPGLKPALRAPVAVYVIVIAAMAGQAAGRWHMTGSVVALAAAVGAGFFVVSDAVLAIDRFRWKFRAARAVTLATYWAAQLLIALSISGA
ncbi:MAG: membrane protein [Betaproteobacteria bacterium]|nr:MAG: membrane protein [Betaproteobacteria bacterium]